MRERSTHRILSILFAVLVAVAVAAAGRCVADGAEASPAAGPGPGAAGPDAAAGADAAGSSAAGGADAVGADAAGADAAGDGLAPLDFLVGEWRTTGKILAPAVGDHAGPYEGVTVCARGGSGVWMACDFETPALAGLGHYAVHVVIWPERGGDGFESFVVNNFGTATYRGMVDAPGRLVFFGGRRGGEQRIVYERQDDGTVTFDVELTRDGARTFLPHTESRWFPSSDPPL